MDCPQCQKPIEPEQVKSQVAVGWCRLDVHRECIPLHVRSCRSCWPHNTAFILTQEVIA